MFSTLHKISTGKTTSFLSMKTVLAVFMLMIGLSANAQLKAKPGSTTYTVTFNGNGGQIEGNNSLVKTFTKKSDKISSVNPDVRADYVFVGWSTSTDGAISNKNTKVEDVDGTTLYAQWIEPYEISANQDPVSKLYISTFYCNKAGVYNKYGYNVPEGVTAYTAALNTETNTFDLSPISDGFIPQNTAVILAGNVQSYTLIPAIDNLGVNYQANQLKGTDEDLTGANIPAYSYILSCTPDNGLGFYPLPEYMNLAAHKAYYIYQGAPITGNGAKAFTFRFLDKPAEFVTGINNVETESADNAIFSINGMRLAAPQKGINIINGKKYILK